MKRIAIIGAGMGGLVAGNLLARKGHAVTVFESHSAPGGYTAGFRRRGFYFESGTLSFESSPVVFRAMKDIGISGRVTFERHLMRIVAGALDGTPETYGDFKRLLFRAFPAEKSRLDRYFRDVDPMYRAFSSVMQDGFFRKVRGVVSLLHLHRKYGGVPLGRFTRRYFDDGSLLSRIFSSLGYPDMSAIIVGGAFQGFLDDYWTVREGMQAWADALADNFRRLGGELLLNSYVDRIIVANGAVSGVRCNGVTRGADYVIAAGDYKKTFLDLLERGVIPEERRERIEKAAVSEGMFVVYLGLDIPNEELKKHLRIPYVGYVGDGPEGDIANAADGDYFAKAPFYLYSPSMKDSRLAPGGKSSLMIAALAPRRWMDNWGGGDRRKYDALKEKARTALIGRATAIVPGLKGVIEVEDAATPLTFERYTHNTDGATSAWSWNPEKKFYQSLLSLNVETPVKNLLVGSSWAIQIGGVPGAIGAAYACANKIR